MQTAKRIQRAVQLGYDLDTIFDNGETALLVSSRLGRDDITQALVANGANVNIADSVGKTPLLWCIENNNADMATVLLQHNADAHQAMGGITPLIAACEMGDETLVQLLLNHGVTVMNVNCFGESAIDVAIRKNHVQLISILITHGSVPKKARSSSKQLLHRSSSVCGSLPQILNHNYKQCSPLYQRSASQMDGRYSILPKISE